MKVFPIKLPDEFYNDLKLVAKAKNISMARLLRTYDEKTIKKQAVTLRDQERKTYQALSTYEYMKKYIHKGPTYYNDLTDDEILYGGKLGED